MVLRALDAAARQFQNPFSAQSLRASGTPHFRRALRGLYPRAGGGRRAYIPDFFGAAWAVFTPMNDAAAYALWGNAG